MDGVSQYGYRKQTCFLGEMMSFTYGAGASIPVVSMTTGLQNYIRIISLVDNWS